MALKSVIKPGIKKMVVPKKIAPTRISTSTAGNSSESTEEKKQVSYGDVLELFVASAVAKRLSNKADTLIKKDKLVIGWIAITPQMVFDTALEMMALPYNQSQGGSLKKYHGENFNSDVKDIIILNFVSKNDKYLKMRETINSTGADILKELNIIAAKCAKYANDNFTDMAKLIYENGIKNEFHVRCDGTTNHTGTKTDVSILENGGLKKKINLSIKGNSAKLHNHTVTKLNTFNQINDIFESAGMKLTMHESEYEHELLHGNILTAVSKLMRSVSPKLVDKSKLVDFMLHATFRHEQNIFFVNFKKAEYKMTDRTKLRQTLTTVLEGETIIKQNEPHVKPDIKVFILDDGTTSKDTKFCGLRLDMTKDGLAIFVEKGEQF